MHPQVCILNQSRKRYVHLNGDKATTDEDIPWGADATVSLSFDVASSAYQIQVCEGVAVRL